MSSSSKPRVSVDVKDTSWPLPGKTTTIAKQEMGMMGGMPDMGMPDGMMEMGMPDGMMEG